MSMKQYIFDQMQAGQRLLDVITPLPVADEYPCRCCLGRGALATKSQFYALSPEAVEVCGLSGAPVSVISVIKCPSCAGSGVDKVAMLDSQRGAA